MFKNVFENIYMLSTGKGGQFPHSYCFYLDDEVKTLIDTPLDTSFTQLLQGHPVDMIINTHFHRDHSGCNHLFPGAKIIAHPADIPAMQSLEVFNQYYGLDKYGAQKDLLSWINFHPSPITDVFHDGDIIDLGRMQLEVIHTPGHSPGHCAFYWREKELLFSGDLDLTAFGPWYGNETSDVDQIITSLEKLIELNPRIILSGHKGMISEGVQNRLKKYLDKLYDNEDKILQSLSRPRTLEELTYDKIIYSRWGKPEHIFYFFEKVSLVVHLRRLLRLGLVDNTGEKYVTTAKY
ncbi:MAG: MBL fold metallo-hydrolase [Syntrophomonadaceae bacterium]|nr:MBL fold metallo-hydrolase [Syntrophomonadaceae bacterium]